MNDCRLDKYLSGISRSGVFRNLLLHVLFPDNTYQTHAKCTPPHYMCFCHSKTPFKCIEDRISNQITHYFALRGL